MEEFTVLVAVEGQDSIESVLSRAKQIFRDADGFNARYDYNSIADSEDDREPTVRLTSDEGQSLVEEQLHKTQKAKLSLLNQMENAINSVETIDNTLADTDLFDVARQFGSWSHPSNYLIDGTSWQFGEPILTKQDLEKITDHYSDRDFELILVNLNAK